VRTAAELYAVVPCFDNADDVAVFFAEERGSAHLLGFLDGAVEGFDHMRREDLSIDLILNGLDFFRRQVLEVGEVEAELVRIHQGTRLIDVSTQDRTQRFVQKVGRRVVSGGVEAKVLVDFGRQGLTPCETAFFQFAYVYDHAAGALFRVVDVEDGAVFAGDDAFVADLAAAFRIERGLPEDEAGFDWSVVDSETIG